MTKKNGEHRKSSLLSRDLMFFLAIMSGVGLIWWGGAYWIDGHISAANIDINDAAVRGQFGDKFGAINALFAGFAFAGIIFTIYLQNKELRQTKEMLKEQLKDSSKQRFDSTFFQLLKLQNEISAKLAETENEGYNSFRSLNSKLVLQDRDYPTFTALKKLDKASIRDLRDGKVVDQLLRSRLTAAEVSNIEESLERGLSSFDNYLDESLDFHEDKFRIAYTAVAQVYVDSYSHYFRNLYHILKFIKQSPLIEDEDRRGYAIIVRSQLSEQELVTIFYNALTHIRIPGRENIELGYPKMGMLLKEFDILHNLPNLSLIHPVHAKIYQKNYCLEALYV
ncbi:putative phage abortive infection protein [Pseudomonas sp. 22-AL-CL-001]|uniref:putative phage abortive infection protein n=1 Tax=Pseudomonas alabamensis TaxID=3064349 RepID=UPI002713AD67|nr:putative phage abortive infection protein [Pseudomonas sp. 22-AL-CL-001]MDO7909212.1 putative phage abortive infection protein [Pseudomonas sp. 22-AL-CL-001]